MNMLWHDTVRQCRAAPHALRCGGRIAERSRTRQAHRSFEDNFWSTKMALPGASIDGALAQP